LIEVLQNREKTLLGAAQDAIKEQIKKFQDTLKALRESRTKEDTSDADTFLVRRRRDASTEVPTEATTGDEVTTGAPASRISILRKLRERLHELTRKMERAKGRKREEFRLKIESIKRKIAKLRNKGKSETTTEAGLLRYRRDATDAPIDVEVTTASRAGIIRRLQQRIAEFTRKMKNASERKREWFRLRIEGLQRRIAKLMKGESETTTGAELLRLRRDADETTEAPETGTEGPGFLERRIRNFQQRIRNLERMARNAVGQQRTLLFRQIDLQRAILDRLLQRQKGE
jgi:hypothetical protein